MVDEPDLVTLFYRADWTQVALSAEVRELSHWRLRMQLSQPTHPKFTWVNVNTDLPPGYGDPVEHRARLRIAPDGRYLIGILTAWDVENPPEDGSVLRTRYGTSPGLPPPYPEVLWPSQLLNAFSLELAERVQVDGRTALRVIATPAPGVWQADEYRRPERIEVIADAETGILLRFEKFLDGQTVELTELTDVTFAPAGEFQVPDGADDDGQDAKSESQFFSGPRWEAAKTATNVFGTVLGTVARHVPRPPRDAAAWEQATADDDPEAAMPPAAGRFDSTVSGSLASDELLHALYRSGRAEFSATLHLWLDGAAWGEWAQARAGDRGWGGIGSAAGVIGGRVGSAHTETRVTIGSAGQYRLDYLRGRQEHKPRAVACDGSRRWLEYDDRVIVGPVLPLPQEITKMVDTAPLLESHVSGVAETQVSGRRGFALRVAADGPEPRGLPWPLKESDLVVDAELGIVLRQIWYAGDAQGLRYEFRDVAPPSADGGEFIFDVPQGVRVEHTDDWVLDELGVPAGMQSAIHSVESAAKAAQGFLNSLRGQ